MGRKTVAISIQFDDGRDDYNTRHPAFTGNMVDVERGIRKRANFAFVGWARVVVMWNRKSITIRA